MERADAHAYYRAALSTLCFVEQRQPTGRRFGAEADARWSSFQGELTTADRIDLLIRDAIRHDAIVHDADRTGPHGKALPNLLRLVEAAACSLADRLLPPERPLLLVQPGLIARYRLEAFLTRLLEASKCPESAAMLLLVPAHDTGGIPRINGELAGPGLHPSQSLWVRLEWLRNRHNEAA